MSRKCEHGALITVPIKCVYCENEILRRERDFYREQLKLTCQELKTWIEIADMSNYERLKIAFYRIKNRIFNAFFKLKAKI